MALNDDERATFARLRGRIEQKRRRNRLRSRLYDAKKTIDQFGISIPPPMRDFATVIGWPQKAVDTPARRIRPDGFSSKRGGEFLTGVQDALADPYAIAVEKLAIQSSLKHSTAFIFTTEGDEAVGEPAVLHTAASALDASATVDPRSGRVTAALERVQGGWTLYLPGETIDISRASGGTFLDETRRRTSHGRVPCAVYTWGRQLDRPFGRSRITRPLIGLTDIGVRVLLRQEVSAEFFSSPQRWLLGAKDEHFTDASGKVLETWEALIGGILVMPDLPIEQEQQEKLRRVEIGQFPQMSMQPHSDHLRTIAMMVSSETSLPLNYLGIVQENPPSADSIRAAEADLTQIVEDELDWYRASRSHLAANTAAILEGNFTPSMAADLRQLRPEFRDPSTPTKSAEGDWAVKIVTAFPWLAESETMLRLIFSEPIAQTLLQERRRATGTTTALQALQAITGQAPPASDTAE